MSWISLLDIMYPVGAVYISCNSNSPAEIVGGTWTRIQDACLAACGSTYDPIAYNGSYKISVNQMPSHIHPLIYSGKDNYTGTSSKEVNSFDISANNWGKSKIQLAVQQEGSVTFSGTSYSSTYTGGGKITTPIALLFTFGEELLSRWL